MYVCMQTQRHTQTETQTDTQIDGRTDRQTDMDQYTDLVLVLKHEGVVPPVVV
jgi:hypothetical protein